MSDGGRGPVHPVAVIELMGLLATLVALVLVCASRKHAWFPRIRFALALLLVLTAFRGMSNALEWLDVPAAARVFRTNLAVVEPLLWAFLIHALVRNVAEQRLHQSQERQRILLGSLPHRIFFKNANSVFVHVNELFAQDVGARPEDIAGKTDFDLYPRELAQKYRSDDKRVMESGRAENLVEKNVSGGVERTVEVMKAPVIDDGGNVVGLCGISTDITERVQAEQARREAEEKYRLISDNATDLIGLLTLDDISYLYVNPATLKAFGYTEEELIGKSAMEFFHPEDKERVVRAFQEGVERGEGSAEFRYRKKDGSYIWLEAMGRVVPRQNGQPAVLIIARETTERKQAEEALQRRVEFEGLVSTISTEFINLPHAQIDDGIDRALRAIGESAGADRSYVFQFRKDGHTVDNTHEWCAGGVEPQIQNLQGISLAEELPWFAQRIRALDVLHVPSVASLSPEAQAEKEHFQLRGIQSLVVVPMVFGDRLLGFLGFDSVRTEKTWPAETIALLQAVGGMFINALDRQQAEEALRNSEERFRSLFESATEFIHVLNVNGRILSANPAAVSKLGYAEDEMVGRLFKELFAPASRSVFEQSFGVLLETGEHRQEAEIVCKDGNTITVDCSLSTIHNEHGEVTSIVALQHDITERVRLRERLRMLSLADPLTGANNRRGFFHLAEQELRFANRSKSALLLLFADLDGLKDINDALGHKEGDQALKETAEVLRETFRESDIIGRVGGDEFAVLAMGAPATTANRIRARIRERLDARNARQNRRYQLSFSAGIADYNPDNPCSLDELMARADALMYQEKRQKRNG